MSNWKILLIALAVLYGGLFVVGAMVPQPVLHDRPIPTPTKLSTPVTKPVEDKPFISYINQLRKEKGLSTLTETEGLDKTAMIKAKDMADHNYFAHVSPTGVRGTELIFEYNPTLRKGTENIAFCYDTNKATFDGWMKSPAHYRGMVDPDVTLFGSASVYDKDRECTLAVNHFGG